MTAAASDSVKCTSSVTPCGRWLRSSSRDNINHGLIAAHFPADGARICLAGNLAGHHACARGVGWWRVQERRYRVDDDIRYSPGQMMACALDELQPGLRQGTG
jgi:hypothetical protein